MCFAFPCNICLLGILDQAHRPLQPLPQSSTAPVSSPRAGGADRLGGGAAAELRSDEPRDSAAVTVLHQLHCWRLLLNAELSLNLCLPSISCQYGRCEKGLLEEGPQKCKHEQPWIWGGSHKGCLCAASRMLCYARDATPPVWIRRRRWVWVNHLASPGYLCLDGKHNGPLSRIFAFRVEKIDNNL